VVKSEGPDHAKTIFGWKLLPTAACWDPDQVNPNRMQNSQRPCRRLRRWVNRDKIAFYVEKFVSHKQEPQTGKRIGSLLLKKANGETAKKLKFWDL